MRRIDLNLLYALNLPEKKWRIRAHCGGHMVQADSSEPSRTPAFGEIYSLYLPSVPGVMHLEIWECGSFFRPAELFGSCDVALHGIIPGETTLLRPKILVERKMLVVEIGLHVHLHTPPGLKDASSSSFQTTTPSGSSNRDDDAQPSIGSSLNPPPPPPMAQQPHVVHHQSCVAIVPTPSPRPLQQLEEHRNGMCSTESLHGSAAATPDKSSAAASSENNSSMLRASQTPTHHPPTPPQPAEPSVVVPPPVYSSNSPATTHLSRSPPLKKVQPAKPLLAPRISSLNSKSASAASFDMLDSIDTPTQSYTPVLPHNKTPPVPPSLLLPVESTAIARFELEVAASHHFPSGGGLAAASLSPLSNSTKHSRNGSYCGTPNSHTSGGSFVLVSPNALPPAAQAAPPAAPSKTSNSGAASSCDDDAGWDLAS